jgi:hypothetical protein
MHRCALFGVETSLNAVVHESHEACRHNDAIRKLAGCCLVRVALSVCTYSEMSESECRIFSSVTRI